MTTYLREYLYLACVLIVAFAIKYWYSHAVMSEIQWMILPLVMLLELFLSGDFEVLANGEWVHVGLQILLVKSCSGINFFIMSFIGYALLIKQANPRIPRFHGLKFSPYKWVNFIGNVLCALMAAWITALIANTIRIILALFLFETPSITQLVGLNDESAHRLAGLIVFIPTLFWQMQIGNYYKLNAAYAITSWIMVLFLIVVPLITINAFNQPDAFIRHSVWLISSIGVGGIFIAIFKNNVKNRNIQIIT